MAHKVFVTQDNMAVFECPKCKTSKRVNVSKYKNINKEIRMKAKCPCGHSYSVVLERRKHYRKSVNSSGTYTHFLSDNTQDKGMMNVKDLSRSGLKITLNVKRDYKVGDMLLVEFRLDDSKRSLINKEVIIRWINDLTIGGEFSSVNPSDPSDAAIGFYMFS